MERFTDERLTVFGNVAHLRWLSVWAGFVIALMVGRTLIGESQIEVGVAVIGFPLAWLAGWILARHETWGWRP